MSSEKEKAHDYKIFPSCSSHLRYFFKKTINCNKILCPIIQ